MKGLLLQIMLGIYDFLWNVLLFFLKAYSPESRIGRWFTLHNKEKKLQESVNIKYPLLLFACSSVGEYRRIETLARHYSKKDFRIEISFFSTSGYNFLKKQDHKWDKISLLPFDRRKDVRIFLQSKNPHYVFVSSNMIWPNFIYELDKREIRYSIVGCSYYQNTRFKKPFLSLKFWVIRKVEYAFCIDQQTQEVLSKYLNVDQIIVTGDPRLDTILRSSLTKTDQSLLTQYKGNKKLLIVGSAYEKEVTVIINAYDTLLNAGYRILIAPHELDHSKNITSLLESSRISCGLYSKAESNKEILLLDTMGMLRDAYSMADIAFIGGGWNKGIHNIVEAMIYNCTLVSGPKFIKFPEARFLVGRDILRVISDANDIKAALEKEKSLSFQSLKRRSYKEWIDENKDSNAIIIKTLKKALG